MTDSPDIGNFPVGVVAYCLDVTPRRIQQLADEGHFPKLARGAYPLAEACRAYVSLLRSEIDRAPSTPDEKEAKARKTNAEAGLAEIELAKARGEVAEIDVVIEAIHRDQAIVRDRLVAIAGRLAGTLTPAQCAAVEDAVNDALEELHSASDVVAEATRGRQAPEEGEDGVHAEVPPQPRGVVGSVSPDRAGKVGKPRKVADKHATRGLRSNARNH